MFVLGDFGVNTLSGHLENFIPDKFLFIFHHLKLRLVQLADV